MFQTHVLSKLKSQLGSSFDEKDPNFIDNNLLKVEIFISDFTYEDIAESPAYPVSFEMLLLLIN